MIPPKTPEPIGWYDFVPVALAIAWLLVWASGRP